jgi:hypothetical protein
VLTKDHQPKIPVLLKVQEQLLRVLIISLAPVDFNEQSLSLEMCDKKLRSEINESIIIPRR